MYTFLLLKEGVTAEDVNRKLGPFSNRHTEEQVARAINLKLQPITDIHLYSNRVFEAPSSDIGDINNVYIFSAIAVLILFIACINFMNLATAHSGKRAREVGMKKVLGAQRKQLIFQFLGESILANLFALLLAIGLIELFIPTFNQLTQKELSLDILDDGFILTGLIGIALLVGIVAGSYPAFFLSAFQPAKALKTKFTLDSTNAR
ncbi:FtsX-like permease family protein, partial [Candidatus Saccharibacteria bacterium]|nr:FtsX-like permease family protein [Calditrichia bacterium]NIW00428.1 FtsX-like permease family protein [Candidatus Saccharibacteria bacterium]